MVLTIKTKDEYFGTRNVSVIFSDYFYSLITSEPLVNDTYNRTAVFDLDVDTAFGGMDWRKHKGLVYYNNNPDIYDIVMMGNVLKHLCNQSMALPTVINPPTGTPMVNKMTIGNVEYNLTSDIQVTTIGNNFSTGCPNPCPHCGNVSIQNPETNSYHWKIHIPIFPTSCIDENGHFYIPEDFTTMRTLFLEFGAWNIQTNNYYGKASIQEWSTSPFEYIYQFPVQLYDYDDDPYDDDESGEGGGEEDQDNWDDDSDPNPVPGLPSTSAVDTGFIKLYNPSNAELKNLANYLWSGAFDLNSFRKIMADPMDTILGLSIVPVNVPSGTAEVVTVGNISTGISMTKATAQYVELDCGEIEIHEKWNSYLDYSPYSRITIVLPYIGAQELDIDQIQGSSIGVKYHIDVLSGACVAFITVDSNVVCEFSGQCAISIPVTSQDFTNTITSLCTLVAAGVGVVATGGLTAPVNAAAVAGLATAAANTAGNVASSKPTFAKTGNMSGSNGLMGIQIPFLIRERPKLCKPGYQNHFMGYPAYITFDLGSVSGFTQVQDIRLDNIPMTDVEREELLTILRKGVIL